MERAEGLRRLGELYQELAELEQALGLSRGSLPAPSGERPVGMRAYELVASYGSDLISIHSASGDYLFVSPSCKRLFGYEIDQLKGHNAYEFFHPDDMDRIAADHAAHGPEREGRVRYRFRCADQSFRWVETRSQSRSTGTGVEQIIAITRDVHEQVEAAERAGNAEQELARAQQLASIGQLAGAVGHELANPLGAAIMGLDAILFEPQVLAPDVVKTLHGVRDSAARAAAVLNELRLLSRERREHGEVHLDVCVHDVLNVSAMRVQGRVDAELASTRVETDPARCHQLVYHMLTTHLAGLPDDDRDARVQIQCATVDGAAMVSMRSRVAIDHQTMVADLVSALRGEEARCEVPLVLAQQVAADLGGEWSVETAAGMTTTTVRFRG
jgi:PAS domain S-box-containing protein